MVMGTWGYAQSNHLRGTKGAVRSVDLGSRPAHRLAAEETDRARQP